MTPDPGQRTVEVIATVSHEIRSPLTTIKGFTKTLIDRWDRLDDDTKLEMLGAINADADRVTRILTELLDISRLEAGKLKLHLQHVDIGELARDVVAQIGDRSPSHSVVVEDGGQMIFHGDPDKLRQVLTNFIENAQKYTDPGTVVVAYAAEGDRGVVRVDDQGPGVSPEAIGGLFEKFARRDEPGAPTGTGLGLYICKGLIEAHGGEIGADSSTDRGSTFWFKVPLATEPTS